MSKAADKMTATYIRNLPDGSKIPGNLYDRDIPDTVIFIFISKIKYTIIDLPDILAGYAYFLRRF